MFRNVPCSGFYRRPADVNWLKQNASWLKETRFRQVYPPFKGHELSEASVTLLIKAVTQMKF